MFCCCLCCCCTLMPLLVFSQADITAPIPRSRRDRSGHRILRRVPACLSCCPLLFRRRTTRVPPGDTGSVVLTQAGRIRPVHQPHRPADVVPRARGHPQLPRHQHDRRGPLGAAARRRAASVAQPQGRHARADGSESGGRRGGAGMDTEDRGVLAP